MNGTPEVMYAIPSPILMLALLVTMGLAIYIGTRMGKNRASRTSEEGRAQVSALQGSLLGLLALLLGFSFSLALGRYDDRSVAVITEANAIGTAWLRTDLVAEPARGDLRKALVDYTAERVAAGGNDMTQTEDRNRLLSAAQGQFTQIWALASTLARETPNPATVSLTSSLNDMIDAFSARDAALNRHVPEPVLWLLFVTFVFMGWTLGFSSRVAGERPSPPVLLLVLLIVLVMGAILDLDRPRRGLIGIDQSAMSATLDAMRAEIAAQAS